jgi:hypothetical protein
MGLSSPLALSSLLTLPTSIDKTNNIANNHREHEGEREREAKANIQCISPYQEREQRRRRKEEFSTHIFYSLLSRSHSLAAPKIPIPMHRNVSLICRSPPWCIVIITFCFSLSLCILRKSMFVLTFRLELADKFYRPHVRLNPLCVSPRLA